MSRIQAFLVAVLAYVVFSSSAFAFTIQVDSSGAPILAWSNSTITFDVNYDACLALGVSEGDLDSTVDAALGLWNSTPSTNLKLARGSRVTTTVAQIQAQSEGGNPLIICDAALGASLAAPGDPEVETKNIPAVAQVLRLDSDRHIALAVIYLNAQSTKAANVKNVLRFANLLPLVLAHEMGHALGLGHSADTRALMYFDATAKTTLSLAQDDMDGITYLYPRHELGNAKIFGCASLGTAGFGPPSAGGRHRSVETKGDSGAGSAAALQFFGLLLVCAALTAGFKCKITPIRI